MTVAVQLTSFGQHHAVAGVPAVEPPDLYLREEV